MAHFGMAGQCWHATEMAAIRCAYGTLRCGFSGRLPPAKRAAMSCKSMPYKVAAFYQFARLADFRELREPLRAFCARLGIKGSVLLAQEGINGTVAGMAEAIDAFVHELAHGDMFGGRLDNLELKFSTGKAMPFGRLKVRLKKEIVTLGDVAADPTRQV